MGNVWKCKICGKINQSYVGTCGCGNLKDDGLLINEEDLENFPDYKQNKKWQCPDCLKINELGICTCGHVKTNSDKFLDEKPDINQTTKSEIKKNLLIAVGIIIIAICAFFLIRSLTPLTPLDGTYYPIGNENICFVLKNKEYKYYDYNVSKKPLYTGSYTKKARCKVVLQGFGEYKYGWNLTGKYIRINNTDYYKE